MQVMLFGGDMRTVRLAGCFERDGNGVFLWGLDKAGLPSAELGHVRDADMLVLPYPCFDGELIRAPFGAERLSFDELCALAGDRPVFAGAPGIAGKNGVKLFDYATERLLAQNARLTAEGALAIAVNEMPVSLSGAEILVSGCGRIGRELAVMLGALGARVSILAWRQESIVWAQRHGCGLYRGGGLGSFDCVFNTVPRCVFDYGELSSAAEDCLFVELASSPGGIDRASARTLGLRLICAPGLPGKTAPATAAEIIYKEIMTLWETEEI